MNGETLSSADRFGAWRVGTRAPARRLAWLGLTAALLLPAGAAAVASELLAGLLARQEWEHAAEQARHAAEQAGLGALLSSEPDPRRLARSAELSGLATALTGVVRVKVWDRRGRLVWADEPRIVGQQVAPDPDLRRALAGTLAIRVGRPADEAHRHERAFAPLAELYVPIFDARGRVAGVLELYALRDRLQALLERVRRAVWLTALASGLLAGLALLAGAGRVYGRELEALHTRATQLEAELADRVARWRAALRTAQELQQRIPHEERMRALGEVASGVAHDVNNVLANILGRIQVLVATADQPELRRQLEVVEPWRWTAPRSSRASSASPVPASAGPCSLPN